MTLPVNPQDLLYYYFLKLLKKDWSCPCKSREGPCCCETSRLPHFLDNRLTDGGDVVSVTRRPRGHTALPTSRIRTLCSLYEQKNIFFYWQCDWPHRALRTPRTQHAELCVARHIVNKWRDFSGRIASIAYVALCVAADLLPGRFLVYTRGWVDPRAIMRLGSVRSIEKSSDFIGNRPHHFPACNIVPQPTTLSRAQQVILFFLCSILICFSKYLWTFSEILGFRTLSIVLVI
jgi:hypothetical protein